MNIKKCSIKAMCAALAGTMFANVLLPAFATEAIVTETPMDENVGGGVETDWTIEEEKFQDVEVTYKQSASYLVTIPKMIALDMNKQGAYSVKVSGDVDTNQRVYVAPVDGITDTENIDFYMKDQTADSKKADVVATVTQNKTYWNSENVADAYEETNNSVSAPDLTAGTWEGTFQVEIRLETEKGQGEEETDPYKIAPAEAYTDWNYTLDEESGIITLNYYIGLDYANPKKDVIVYANYVIDGKTYKTQIKSNDENATNRIAYMFNNNFNYCQHIETIKFSDGIDTGNVTNMSYMFYSCPQLTDIDLGANFDTSNVTNMANMFAACTKLVNLDVSNFDTSNVTNMSGMFSNGKFTSLDLSNFDTGNVTDMSYMFNDCTNLTSLDLGNFDTSRVTNMTAMFQHSTALAAIYVTEGKWSTSQAKTSNIFNNCGISEVTYQ